MSYELHSPGSILEAPLGDTGVTVHYSAPTEQQAREIRRWARSAADNNDRHVDYLKTAIGFIIKKLDGIKLDGEDVELELETDKSGRLTENSLATILPLSEKLHKFVLKLIGLDVDEAKN